MLPFSISATGSAGAPVFDQRLHSRDRVFSGGNVDWSIPRDWDMNKCSFPLGTDVIRARIAEDDAALARLGARAHRLEFLDAQYRNPESEPPPHVIGERIMAAISHLRSRSVILPLGLVHGDHKLSAAGAAHAARCTPELAWFAYQDLPYAYEKNPGIEDALAKLADMAPTPVELSSETRSSDKGAAIDMYLSQMRGLGARRKKAMRAERYWILSPGE